MINLRRQTGPVLVRSSPCLCRFLAEVSRVQFLAGASYRALPVEQHNRFERLVSERFYLTKTRLSDAPKCAHGALIKCERA